jgi:hypothetical protein
VVTLVPDPKHCAVQAPPQAAPREMSCQIVGNYIRRTLNPPSGAIIGIKTQGFSPAALYALSDGLEKQGFESGGTECWVSKSRVGG